MMEMKYLGEEEYYGAEYECSNCNERILHAETHKYCAYCGAKIKKYILEKCSCKEDIERFLIGHLNKEDLKNYRCTSCKLKKQIIHCDVEQGDL